MRAIEAIIISGVEGEKVLEQRGAKLTALQGGGS